MIVQERVEHVLGKVQCHGHRIAVVVVGNIVAPVQQARIGLTRVREVPPVQVNHPVAAVDLNHRCDENNHVLADVLDVRRVVDGQPVGELHQRGRGAGFCGVDGAGDVVHGKALPDERGGFFIGHAGCSRVGKLRKPRAVRVQLLEQQLIADSRGDHLPAFLALADGKHLDARRVLLEQAKVPVHVFRVGKLAGCPGNVPDHGGRRRHSGRRRGQVIREGRVEVRLGRVLPDRGGVALVDRLMRIACVLLPHDRRQSRIRHLRPAGKRKPQQKKQIECALHTGRTPLGVSKSED